MNLTQMATDVALVNRANGWYESDRDFDTDIALLHTEISEAFDAYRVHKFEDATRLHGTTLAPGVFETGSGPLPKPEGVGSELADVLIRFLDTADRYLWNLDAMVSVELDAPPATFAAAINELHHLAAIMGYDQGTAEEVAARFYGLLIYTADDIAQVEIEAEYVRKLAYNKTRGHRHGGKLV